MHTKFFLFLYLRNRHQIVDLYKSSFVTYNTVSYPRIFISNI